MGKLSGKSVLAFEEGFNLLPDAIIIFTTSGRILNCNQSTLRQFGVKSKWEIIGTNLFEWISEADRTKAMDSPSFGIEKGFKKSVEFLFLKVDGTEYPAEFTVVPMVDSSGKASAQIGIIRDITERKMIEEELEESKETVKALLNAPQDAAYLVDRYGKVYAANDFGARVLGKRGNEIIGLNLFRLLPPDLGSSRREKVADVIRSGVPVRFEDRLGKRVYENSVYPVYGPKRKVNRVAIFARDITERNEMEEELRRYSDHLQELVEERTKQLRDAERLAAIGETATMVGHDLRNPLQVIINTIFLARTMVEEAPPEVKAKLQEYDLLNMFDTVDKQVEYMNKIVSDLQDFARELKPRIVMSGVAELFRDAIPSIVPPNVTVKTESSIETAFYDPYMMKRVLVNLITNAVQALPNGGEILIKVYNEGDKTIFKVVDNGVGIPDEFKPKLFMPLSTTKSMGTGMGLAVVKRLVTAQGGTISVESEVGRGTTFIIALPATPAVIHVQTGMRS